MVAEWEEAVLGDWTPTWTADDASRAVERAPSLAGRARLHMLADSPNCGGGSSGGGGGGGGGGGSTPGSKLAIAVWAVKELKEVHSGKANQHVHDALDQSLKRLGVA